VECIRVKNVSQAQTYKDIHFKTYCWAPSGTPVDQSLIGHTEYIKIPPGKSASISFTEFTNSQATRANISIVDAEISQD
jgi:hypothetical protein